MWRCTLFLVWFIYFVDESSVTWSPSSPFTSDFLSFVCSTRGGKGMELRLTSCPSPLGPSRDVQGAQLLFLDSETLLFLSILSVLYHDLSSVDVFLSQDPLSLAISQGDSEVDSRLVVPTHPFLVNFSNLHLYRRSVFHGPITDKSGQSDFLKYCSFRVRFKPEGVLTFENT